MACWIRRRESHVPRTWHGHGRYYQGKLVGHTATAQKNTNTQKQTNKQYDLK
jgi:hypothetical protein